MTLQSFVPSSQGSNGNFRGKDAQGNVFSVENDVGSYSTMALTILSFGAEAFGLTKGVPPFSPNVNYTANDLLSKGGTVEMYQDIQIHELAHSLDMLTSVRLSVANSQQINSETVCFLVASTRGKNKAKKRFAKGAASMRVAVWFTSLLATPILLTFCARNWARLERQNLPRWRNLISVSFVLIVGVLWIFVSVPPIIGLGGFRHIDFSGRVSPEFF